MIKDIFSQRRQVRYFDEEKIPNIDLVKKIIIDSYNLVPSKQNLVPYKVHVIGPYNNKINKELYRLACIHELGGEKYKERYEKGIAGNTQLLYAPYNILFEKRCPVPNKFVEERLKEGHSYPNLDPKRHHEKTTDAKIEIGMFCSIVTGLCVEQGIDVSYTACLPDVRKDGEINPYKEILSFIESNIFLALSIGYRHPTVDDKHMLSRMSNKDETKPNIEDVVIWHYD
mgnify:CR=1 FL=1